jgi:hypothetical protein
MSFDPRTPCEIHYVEAKSGDDMVECLETPDQMEARARDLIARGQSRPGTMKLYHVTRRRVGLGS